MSRTVPSSQANGFARAYATNATDTSFAARADTTAEPTGDGVLELVGPGRTSPTWVSLLFFGTGDANDEFAVRVYGVRRNGGAWTCVPLFEGTATLGTKTGVAGGNVGAAELYADTLAAAATSFGVADNSFRVVSPADNSAARLLLDSEGFEKLLVDFDATTGSPTGMNALWAGV